MNRDSMLNVDKDVLNLKKHLIAVSGLYEIAIELVSTYHLLKNDPHNLHLGMIALEREKAFSCFLHTQFRIDIESSSCKLKDLIMIIADIAMDFFYSNISLFQPDPECCLDTID